MGFYRVLEGKHFGKGPKGCECDACLYNQKEYEKVRDARKEGIEYVPRLRDHAYRKGDIVETEFDLLAFNQPPRSMKFEKVDSIGRPVSQLARSKKSTATAGDFDLGDGLEELTVEELRKLAEEEEIDLGSASRKDDIIKEIRKSMVQSAVESGFRS